MATPQTAESDRGSVGVRTASDPPRTGFVRPRSRKKILEQKRALLEHPSAVWIHRTLCPAHVLGGDHAEAKRSATALRERYPDLTLTEVQQNLPPLSRSYCERISEGLRSVGLPD